MNTASLSAHDKGIYYEVQDLEKRGWNVKADLPRSDHSQPPLIAGKRRPDIIATKRGGRRIVEIKTELRLRSKQLKTFRRSAGQRAQVKFYGRGVNAVGQRIESFGNPPGDILG